MRYLFFYALALSVFKIYGQIENTDISLTPRQIESVFLERNLGLIAEKMNVSVADAEIIQAKLWDNPSFSINDLNLWSTGAQRDGETIPPLFGSFGRNMQFSVELSQIINLSGKRGKRVAMQKVSRDMALTRSKQLLKCLKLELRKSIAELIYNQSYKNILLKQRESLESIVTAYKKQYYNGNISKSDMLRLQSAQYQLDNEINIINTELNGLQKTMRNLLCIQSTGDIRVTPEEINFPQPMTISLESLINHASESHPDIILQRQQTGYYKKSEKYEKSLRVPDLNISVGYDRRGGVWRDFIGFGIGIDIPVFNRNQGAIKAAEIYTRQSEVLAVQQENAIRNELAEAYNNYINTYHMYEKSSKDNFSEEMDGMLGVFTKNMIDRNISIVEYMDFFGSYLSSKNIVLTVRKEMSLRYEELQYAAGTEINSKTQIDEQSK